MKASCPDYEAQIQELLTKYENEIEIPEDEIPENILELLLEEFAEPEPEVVENDEDNEDADDEENNFEPDLEELLEAADNKISELKSNLLKAKQDLEGLKDAQEALKETHKSEIAVITEQWEGTKAELREHLKPIKEEHKERLKALKEEQKTSSQQLKNLIKQLEKEIPQAEYDKNLFTTKGKLSLILADDDLLQKLSDRFIDAEVAKQLDYPIFMAVSEQGGKNNSGEYEYLMDENGNMVEDENGNPVFKQDLVNYNITKVELENMNASTSTNEVGETLPMAAEPVESYQVKGKPLEIAEAFVKYAKEQKFNFWK